MIEESVTLLKLTLFVRYEENQFREVSKVALTDEAALANDERRLCLCFFFVDVGVDVDVASEGGFVFKGSDPVGEDLRTIEEVGVGHGYGSELLTVVAAAAASSWSFLYCSPSPYVTIPSSTNRL